MRGGQMKLLVISNVSGSVDKIVDILQNRSNVIAKESNATSATIAPSAAEQLSSGAYDMVLVVARDPIGAGMLLNKQEGIDAAVCNSVDDVKLAKDNGANVIVVRDIDSAALQDIVVQAAGGGFAHGMKMPQVKMPQMKMPEMKMPQMGQKQQPEREEKKQKSIMAKKQKEEEEEVEERHTSNDGTLIGKIKDYLGIL